MRNPLPSRLLVVTDRLGARRPLAETVRAVLEGGGRWIWLRERDLDAPARRDLARDLLGIVRGAGGRLVVGADPDLCAAIGADGVHLPGATTAPEVAAARRRLGPAALIGVSAHGAADLAEAAEADYVTLSPIFASASKPGYGPALGLDGLRAGCAAGIPVIALGGLAPEAAPACRAAGAAGVAVMGGLMRAQDPAAAARTFLDAVAVSGRILRG